MNQAYGLHRSQYKGEFANANGILSNRTLRKFGYSRDKRSDCVQVAIALIVTPDGFPLAYEVMDRNTSDKTTLKEFLAKIEKQYRKAKRTWVMDRGIPTEEVLAEMRNFKNADPLSGRLAARAAHASNRCSCA
jgi:transposase